jgi:hypothetical protein
MPNVTKGFLGELFTGVVAKRLTLVETISKQSNQHEFQGIKPIKSLFGTDDRKGIPTRFVWLEAEQSALADEGFISWSNVRKDKPRAAEFHLYYNSNTVTEMMEVDDIAFIALRPDDTALVVIIPHKSPILPQMYWLFGIDQIEQLRLNLGGEDGAATFKDLSGDLDAELDFAARFILDALGIEFELPEADWLDSLLVKYPGTLPSTDEFASFARGTCKTVVSAAQEPDHAIMAWLDHEEKLFRRHEHLFLAKRLDEGFMFEGKVDVEGFIKLSKSVLQRRSSRMGYSLEHHLSAVFKASGLRFDRGPTTERTSKPDFIFPGIAEYRNVNFDTARLTMLASKSSLKDRWRQATKEADRINRKHVFTLERGISVQQTDEMKHQNVQLVLPRAFHDSFRVEQREWLWDLSKFVTTVKNRELAV